MHTHTPSFIHTQTHTGIHTSINTHIHTGGQYIWQSSVDKQEQHVTQTGRCTHIQAPCHAHAHAHIHTGEQAHIQAG